MSNPGLIERFDISIVPHRRHRKQAATVKFIWTDKTIVKELDNVPSQVELTDVRLAKGTGWMEAQLHIDGKMHAVQEVRIKPHSTANVK